MQSEAESRRVAAVRALQLLDSPREERFDRVVRLAQRVFDVPVAAVTLIDTDRQWNKASVGVPAQEFPRSQSVCDYTIRQPEPLIVHDLAADDRFSDMPSLQGPPPLRFYAGQALEAAGQRVGTICLFDERPRQLSEAQTELLVELAHWVERELAAAEDLRHAAEVQRRLQPRTSPDVPGYDVAGRCLTAAEVGGDFFDWYDVQDRFQLVLGDVMGKGIGAAIIAAGVRATLRGASRFNALPEAVARTAYSLQDDLDETGSFVTAFAARLDPGSACVEFVDAGHGLTGVIAPDGGFRQLSTGGLPMGTLPDDRWDSCTTTLAPGETLVSVSDGFLDCYATPREALHVVQAIAARSVSARAMVDEVVAVANERVATDDVTVLAVRRLKPGVSGP